MSHLTHRAEQALLGALLALPELPPDLMAGLRSDDFGHRGHQQVFSAVLELREQQPWLKGDDRLTAVAARVSSPGADRQWLEELRDRAARPSHLGAYAAMVQEAALRRDVALHAGRIAGQQVLPDLAQAYTGRARLTNSSWRSIPTLPFRCGSSTGLSARTRTSANGCVPRSAAQSVKTGSWRTYYNTLSSLRTWLASCRSRRSRHLNGRRSTASC